MNARTIIIGIVVIALLALAARWAIGGSEEEPGTFDQYTSCAHLIAVFETLPVPDSASARRQLGDEYRARFRELDCSL